MDDAPKFYYTWFRLGFWMRITNLANLDVGAVVGDGVGVAAALDGEDAADAEAGGAVPVGRGARAGLGGALGRRHARPLQRGVGRRRARVLLRAGAGAVDSNRLLKMK